MSKSPIALAVTFVLAATPIATAQNHAPPPTPQSERDIVETAVAAGSFTTLLAAAKAAGLVDALRADGPITVFAPTDDAFAALPEGTVATLLEPANRERLRRVLTFHVVAGAVRSSDLLPIASTQTLAGERLGIGLRIGGANVVTADIECSNGVIHVIDAVLLPPAASGSEADMYVEHALMTAIDDGVPLFNDGDPDACARVYRDAAQRLARSREVSELHRMVLTEALTTPAKDATNEAWTLRDAFDRMMADIAFEPRIEAPMPEGFPGPGPVGRVVKKEYPRYRAARAAGGRAFWKLFEHIKKNDVQMTAPVEMTMDDDMKMQDMAFLYERPTQGESGGQGTVEVLDIDPLTVLSIGMRGRRDATAEKRARTALEAELARSGLRVAGAWRSMGYSSPMVSPEQRFWELQVPVAPRDHAAEESDVR